MGKAVRRLYVKLSDLDPSCGGIGFTEGCKGCKSIISGGERKGHDEKCRMRLMETAAKDPSVAARVEAANKKEEEWLARKLEEAEEKKKRKSVPDSGEQSSGSRPSDDRMGTPDRSSSSSSGLQPESRGAKRSAENQQEPEDDWRESPARPVVDPDLVDDARRRADKRVALEEPPKGEEVKQQRIGDSPMGGLELQSDDDDRGDSDSENLLMRALEDREGRAQWLETADVCMPMTVCEEAIDISYLGTLEAAGLSEAIAGTKVGEVRTELEKSVNGC